MRALLQRVSKASVSVNSEPIAAIGRGLLVFLGIEPVDTLEDITWLSGKICRLRVFNDEAGVMNRSIDENGGEILLVSQFTLFASTRKGNRPSYSRAAPGEVAAPMFEQFAQQLEQQLGKRISTGRFGADMQIALINDGPVTIFIDSKLRE